MPGIIHTTLVPGFAQTGWETEDSKSIKIVGTRDHPVVGDLRGEPLFLDPELSADLLRDLTGLGEGLRRRGGDLDRDPERDLRRSGDLEYPLRGLELRLLRLSSEE